MDLTANVKGIGLAGDQTYAIVLEAGGRYLPVMVTGDQARSTQIALDDEPFERPLTHDLLLKMVNEMGGALDRIIIDDLMDGTFYAKIHIERYSEGEREKFVFDARPSDAVSLAVRTECDIEVSEEVMDEAGKSEDEIEFRDAN
ncbi:MAG: bifunctional nuclease family protein [Halobacteria archaeon]|nr:bifunctional nuclease family protein [Halobacteria archaeon]